MANRKILLDPSKWVVDEDQKVALRYRIVTNDLNVRSAFSPMYRVQVPAINEVFSNVTYAITTESVVDNTVIRVVWTTAPVYENFVYYVFLQGPGDSDYNFIKSTQETSFSYVVPNNVSGVYSIAVTMPTVTNTALPNARLLVASESI
jgi:hypothetical protein